jgi:hypothetical protein
MLLSPLTMATLLSLSPVSFSADRVPASARLPVPLTDA